MADTVRVTVAPGSVVTVPHPSGVLGKPYVVREGESVRVERFKVDELWRRGLILHPETGALHPSKQPQPGGNDPGVWVDGVFYTGAAGTAAIAAAEQRLRDAGPPPSVPEPQLQRAPISLGWLTPPDVGF